MVVVAEAVAEAFPEAAAALVEAAEVFPEAVPETDAVVVEAASEEDSEAASEAHISEVPITDLQDRFLLIRDMDEKQSSSIIAEILLTMERIRIHLPEQTVVTHIIQQVLQRRPMRHQSH